MKQLGFFIDIDKCLGCQACSVACQKDNRTNDIRRRRVQSSPQGENEIIFSSSCHHCEIPACMTVCDDRAISKRSNGIVVLHSNQCQSCGKCISVCPFGAIQQHPLTQKADKCDFCYEKQRKGEIPSCVSACIVGALSVRNIHNYSNTEYQSTIKEYYMKDITNPSTRYKYTTQAKEIFLAAKEGRTP